MNYIPIHECKHNHLYEIDGLTSNIGIWNYNKFIVRGYDFQPYLSSEDHYDSGGTAKPLRELCYVDVAQIKDLCDYLWKQKEFYGLEL